MHFLVFASPIESDHFHCLGENKMAYYQLYLGIIDNRHDFA